MVYVLMDETVYLNSTVTSTLQCSEGDCSSCVLFEERKIAVWIVSVWVVFGMKESARSRSI